MCTLSSEINTALELQTELIEQKAYLDGLGSALLFSAQKMYLKKEKRI